MIRLCGGRRSSGCHHSFARHSILRTNRGVWAARGPYYTIKLREIAGDADYAPAAAPAHALSAIEQSISRIRTTRPCPFVLQHTKSSTVINLQNGYFGDLRANHQRICAVLPIAQIAPMAMHQLD